MLLEFPDILMLESTDQLKWNEGEGVDAISSVVSTTSKLGVLIESSISENNFINKS